MNWQFLRCYRQKPGRILDAPSWQRTLSGGVAAFVVAGIQSLGWFIPAEEMVYRTWYQLRGPQTWDSRIAIVAIDEAAIKELYGTTQSRQTYVKLLQALAPAKPSLIVLNVIVDEPAPEDVALAQQMQVGAPTVLTVAWNQEGNLKLPNPLLLQQAVGVGHVVNTAGADGITRTLPPEIQKIPALGVASYQAYLQRVIGSQACVPQSVQVSLGDGREFPQWYPACPDVLSSLPHPFWVNWPASKSQIQEYPILDVIRGQVSATAFTDKIVLVGPIVHGLDILQTPYDRNSPASGVHLQAAILHNLLNDNYLRPIALQSDRPLNLLLYVLGGCLIGYGVALRTSSNSVPWSLRRQLVVGVVLVGGLLVLSFVLFQNNYLLPAIPPIAIYTMIVGGEVIQERLKMRDRLRVSEQQLWKQAFYDNLTGLPNRALLLQRLEQATARAKWDSQYQFAVLFIELDRYKVINSHRGHSLSDQLLVAIAAKMQASLETQLNPKAEETGLQLFTLAHFSGDTFTILLENLDSLDDAIQVAEQIYALLSVPLSIDGQEVFCSVSIGIAASATPWASVDAAEATEGAESVTPMGLDTSPYAIYSSLTQHTGSRGGRQPEMILREAEIAMYQAKARGKVPFALFNRNLYREALGLLQLETDLRRAIAQSDLNLDRAIRRAAFYSDNPVGGFPADPSALSTMSDPPPPWSDSKVQSEFRLDYQPIVSLVDGKISAFEALVRWLHPQRGMISPVEFIPLAEETGLITSLGWWILREACCQLRAWQESFPQAVPVTMVVNLSAIQLMQLRVKEQIQLILHETGVDSRYLKLEITESGLMENVDATIELLEQLKALGIQLSIDDFGTGYSSLGRLHYLPVDTLKIDQSFIRRTTFEEESWEIVQTIITLAHNLNMTVVAEGVETPEQLARLKYLGCDYGQGYLFAKPLSSANATTLLMTNPQW